MRLAFTVFLVLFLLSANGHAGMTDPPAPLLPLHDRRAAQIMEQYRGKVLFLVFWAPWCHACKYELPALDRLYGKYRSSGFEVIGICEDAKEPAVMMFLRNVPVSFPNVIDRQGAIAEKYRLSSLPSGYLIDTAGFIRHSYRGFNERSPQVYEKDIVELLKQVNP
jgi:thiol-disulfide isomerase/thioredoxin